MDENFEEKKLNIAMKIKKRDDERKAEANRRKEQTESKKPENEKLDVFDANFNEMKKAIEEKLDKDIEQSHVIQHVDDVMQDIRQLQKLLTDSTKFLPSVRINFTQNTINKLEKDLKAKEEQLKPKKKFAFKTAKKVQGPLKSNLKMEKTNETVKRTNDVGFSIEEREDENIVLKQEQINQKDILISKMKNCTVRILGSPGTVHIVNIDNCTILSGPSSTSVFIELSKNSKIVMAAQQFRIHKTYLTDFYIHVTSRAIIEDCKDVRFAPYGFTYENLEDHYQISALDRDVNNWQLVNDFNWLTTTKKSPNWDVLPEGDRQEF